MGKSNVLKLAIVIRGAGPRLSLVVISEYSLEDTNHYFLSLTTLILAVCTGCDTSVHMSHYTVAQLSSLPPWARLASS